MLSEEDALIRKKWFRSSLVYLISFPVVAVLILLIELLGKIPTSTVVVLVSSVILGGWGVFGMSYLFAYRKFGTRYLTFLVTIGPFSMLKNIVQVLKGPQDLWSIIFVVTEITFYIWWYRCTLDLRKVNKKMKDMGLKRFEEPISTSE